MNVAEFVIACLVAEEVRYVFGVPGEETEDLLFALADNDQIEFIPTRHEQGAAFMANAWGRITGQAGVCLSTLGPGATNLVTGVADANLDKVPLVALTGQGDIQRLHHESHQNIDVVNLYAPITKWNSSIKTPEVTAEIVRKAFKLAQAEKPGATHIELSEGVARQAVAEGVQPIQPTVVRRPEPSREAMAEVRRLIDQASFPLILAGNGAIRNRVSEALTNLVRFTNIPVVSTFMGKGAISDELPQSLFAVGLGFKDYIMEAFERADLIITVGFDIAEYSPDDWNPDNNTKIIHFDLEPAEVYTNYHPEVEVIGDLTDSLRSLFEQLSRGNQYKNLERWYAPIRDRILNDIQSYSLATEDESFHVPGVINIIREHLDDDGLLISDVGTHKMWVARNFLTYCFNGCLISNGLASMGISLPGGIAASLADSGRQVVSIMGDGGFMMNVQELATAQMLGVNLTIIVLNDEQYGLIKWKQERNADRSAGTRLVNPDFVKLAESFGIESSRPSTVSELDQQIKASIQSPGIQLIAVPVDSSINQVLTNRLEDYFAETAAQLT